ncbi:MAG: homocysteine S-methyltransferase family protein [Treponema sp.]|jgi:5-methyltetrahydrofolate--homocysteine methyltransferase|nr:homocysteine S-methyltransferase family protein [Treponema sp.]
MASQINVREKIGQLAKERVLILDGAMGALIQAYRTPSGQALAEDDFRGLTSGAQGERFRDHPRPLKGCNDLLCLTMPEIITGIHEAYLNAGADIIETCSFNANAVSLADYGLENLAYEINVAAARLARKEADRFSTPDKPRFVAGSIGPTPKSSGFCQDMNNPEKRAITWDELQAAYYDNARGLLDGGVDIILIETVFDTLNAKAAIFAARRLAEERGIDVPVIVSATVSEGGRLLSGQTVEAFCVSVLHANPLALGLNCSFGAEKLKPHIAAVSSFVPCMVIAYPNAGLPNRFGAYDETPESMANHIEGYLRDGLVNITGGCCGSTPAHIAAVSERAKNYSPRPLPALPRKTLLAGLELREIDPGQGLALSENNKTAGELSKLMREGKYEDAVDILLDTVDNGAAIVEVRVDDVEEDAMICFLNTALFYPDIARLPIMISSSDWALIEAGLKCLPGKGLVNYIGLEDSEADYSRRSHLAHNYGAAVVAELIDEQGQADSEE